MGKIIIGEKAGFCFGVERALRITQESREQNQQPVYILGALIHNPRVIADLERQGVKTISDLKEAEPGGILLIRSHGAGPQVFAAARERGLKVIDATCPFVRQEQNYAQELQRDGYQVLVVGDPDHPEVKAVVDTVEGDAVVVNPAQPDQWRTKSFKPKLGLVCQTTLPQEKLAAVVEALLPLAKELKIFNTICHATRERQTETAKLAQEVDVLLVIGGKNSANTRKLVEIGAAYTPTYHIESGEEINPQWLEGKKIIGVTAGASTPQSQISEVVDWLQHNYTGGITMENQVTNGHLTEEVDKVENAEATMDSEAMDSEALLLNQEIPRLEVGEIIEATVVAVDDGEIAVNVGGKSDYTIPLAELTSEKVESARELVRVGDRIKVMVLQVGEEKTRLSKKKADEELAWLQLKDAFQKHQRVSGKIIQAVKGGLQVSINGLIAFLPASHADLGYVSNLSTLVGLEAEFYVIDFDAQRHRVVLSRKEVLAEEQAAVEAKVFAELAEGQTRKGVVTRLTPFGAFVDIGGGVEGLLHVSEIAWERISHPSARLKEGEEIEVLVTKVDPEAKRISLSLKQLSPHPWSKIGEKYKVGDIVEGKVVRLTSFGAFVNLEEGVDGLIHISQLSDRRVEKPEDVVQVGQTVRAKVLKVEPEEKRIGLSIRAAQEKPKKEEPVREEKQAPVIPGLEDKPLSSNLGDLLAEKMGLDQNDRN
ncbi:bifunctional 4-hydroxy-3-methylbut-2-enyl diphosphate reductase/30S ribosomal protein S1 [Capillibacterium thermochitinicola]|uniref:4-hydroxy-3-methylbut-2-enyl diphosphate reductase n=1 Tax=Capillibacterium thermochitinicola TaxID=2699427 RepID=A0A8J6I134_9FIRM|nr:bifunctional 4-hydroxy-3-methylbut-2-enyl diphosphate reductase/30S ribosomal protein S1 [Capillibacterium thermochitinicola]MBA2133511.1 bifunctional 4-hydroxy-3-methylbut-2-enyl diphosphate reductase/30S ribosomal protein S1 [Capillibacterium thermochitinicola]